VIYLKDIDLDMTRQVSKRRKGAKRDLILFCVGLLVLLVLSLCFTVVPAGHVGVIYSFAGGVKDNEFSEGFHVKAPWESVVMYSVRTQDYTMSSIIGEGVKSQADSIQVLTIEGLTVDLDLTVYYRLDAARASEIHKTVGPTYDEVLIRPKSREVIRTIVSGYSAQQVYSQGSRELISREILDGLREKLSGRPILIESVSLRNVVLPDKVKDAIEVKLEAEQEAKKMEFVIEKESLEADRKRIEAEGIRDSQRTIDESLTSEYLTWYWIQSLKEHSSVLYVPVGDNGMPLMKNVDQANRTA